MTACDRCGKGTIVTTMSWFNTDIICPECDKAEQQHPQFAEAKRVESEHVRAGNTRFGGIGLPDDLRGTR